MSVSFLLDENASATLRELLPGKSARKTVELGLSARADDMDVINLAFEQRSVLVSSDVRLILKCRSLLFRNAPPNSSAIPWMLRPKLSMTRRRSAVSECRFNSLKRPESIRSEFERPILAGRSISSGGLPMSLGVVDTQLAQHHFSTRF